MKTTRQWLASGALAILNPKKYGLNIGFDMGRYTSGGYRQINQCGTTCCYAGHVMTLMVEAKEIDFKVREDGSIDKGFGNMFSELLGDSLTEVFLTAGNWPSDKLQCLERVRLYLEGKMPKDFVTGLTEFKVRKNTIAYLRKVERGDA